VASLDDYRQVWNTIKATGFASITVSNEASVTIVTGIIHAKAKENRQRKYSGLMYWSKLGIKRTKISATMQRIEFTLIYPTKL